MNPMPLPDMPPSIQNPQKSCPNSASQLLDQPLGERIGRPRNDGLDRLTEVSGRGRAHRPNVAAPQGRNHLVEHGQGVLTSPPFRVAPQQILFGDHLQDGTDVLGHAAMDDDQESISA